MYEIWRKLDVGWELATAHWPIVITYLVLAAVLYGVAARKRTAAWRQAVAPTLIFGALVIFISLFAIPMAAASSIASVKSLLDWLTLLALSFATGLLAAALLWPALALAGLRGGRLHRI